VSRIAELVGEADHVAITTLTDNIASALARGGRFVERLRGSFIAEHGLSLLIEVTAGGNRGSFLLDTGQGYALKHNMEELKLDAGSIQGVVISHGHYDHTGGLIELLNSVGRELPVVAHPDAFKPSVWIRRRGSVRAPFLPVSKRRVEEAGGRLLLTSCAFPLFTGALTTGEVERRTPFEQLEGVFYLDEGEVSERPIKDDQAIIIVLKRRGLAIASGCSHSGIVNIVEQARRLTGINKVCCVVGGFHLAGASEERVEKTIQYLKGLKADVVSPMHCSGFEFTCKAASELPDCFVANCVGTRISL